MSGPNLALYTREGCHLCEAMLAELRAYLNDGGAQVQLVDIDQDPELLRQYGTEVPVLLGDGHEICRHRLDHTAVQAYLNGQSA